MIIRNIEDKIAACYADQTTQFSDFMTLEEIAAADHLLRDSGLYYRFWGGYDTAERKMVMMGFDDDVIEYPFTVLCGRWDKFGEISHRDVLGAVMASGIERKCVGDILFDKVANKFYLFAINRMSEYIIQNVSQMGRCSITWEIVKDISRLPVETVQEIKVSVPSLRVDAVIATVFHLSRQKAQDVISEKKVFVDHALVSKTTLNLREGSSVVVRGMGKIIFLGRCGFSKKGKIYILIKQYL